MTRTRLTQMLVAGGLASGAFALAVPAGAVAADVPASRAVALTAGNKIQTFESLYPGEAGAPKAVTGLNAGDALVGIDVRPQNGALYALGFKHDATTPANSTIQLYALSSRTAVATPIGTPQTVAGTSATTEFGFDFNPTVDRIRVVSTSGLNLRLNPNTGAVAATDTAISPTASAVDGAAYTNNEQNATATTLYTFSGAGTGDRLYIQTPPNNGVQTAPKPVTVGGTAIDSSAAGGFDITPGVDVTTSNAAAPAGSNGVIAVNTNGAAVLATLDLNTGAARPIGKIGDGKTPVRGLAVQQEEKVGGLPSVSLDGSNIRRFNTATPATGVTVPLTGIDAAETPVAADWRPQTGQLYVLGVNAAADTATLYVVDPQTTAGTPAVASAVATRVGATTGAIRFTATDLPTGGYDIDFNPSVDRLRVVTSSGLNFRVNPLTGGPVDGNATTPDPLIEPDGAQNAPVTVPPASPAPGTDVSGTAYTNSFGQTTPSTPAGLTTQYGISAGTDQLQIQTPPNDGTQTAAKPLGVDATGVLGFDIPATVATKTPNAAATGSGLAVLSTSPTARGLYAVNLTTGKATLKGSLATAPTSLAVGDGPAPTPTRPAPTTPTTPTTPGGGSTGGGTGGGGVSGGGSTTIPVTPLAGFASSAKVTLKLRATKVRSSGPAKITIRNRNAFAVKVRLTAKTAKSGRRKAIRYATKRFSVKKSTSRTVRLRLTSSARKVLRTKKKLKIAVTLRLTAPNGKSKTVRKTLNVRRK